jgi:branched-chain amino acid transport system permease protein
MVMVLLGGAGTLVGPVIGAFALLLLEEGLKAATEHWPLPLGALIVAMVVFLQGGLWGLLGRPAAPAEPATPAEKPRPAVPEAP